MMVGFSGCSVHIFRIKTNQYHKATRFLPSVTMVILMPSCQYQGLKIIESRRLMGLLLLEILCFTLHISFLIEERHSTSSWTTTFPASHCFLTLGPKTLVPVKQSGHTPGDSQRN